MNAWSRWVALWDRREPGTALALFRIAIGLCALFTVGSVVRADLVDMAWIDRSHGGYRSLKGGSFLIDWLGGATPEVIWPLIAASLLCSSLLVLGVGGPLLGRLVAFATLQTTMAVTDVNSHAGGSYDQLLTNALWLLVLGPGTSTLSVHCRLKHRAWTSGALVPAWPRYLAIVQLVLMYWTTGLQKLSVYWVPGGEHSALYYILQQPTWHRFDMRWVAHVYPLTQVATLATWLWEVGAPLLLLAYLYRDTRTRGGRLRALFNRLDVRTLYAALGAFFHVGIHALMDVGPFSLVSLAFYAALWHPDEWRRGALALARATRRGGSPPASAGRSSPRPATGAATACSAPSTSGPSPRSR